MLSFISGPEEAHPILELLALEIKHLRFETIGRFRYPRKFAKDPTRYAWHGDIRIRPNERDFLRVEFFIEEKLEGLIDRSA